MAKKPDKLRINSLARFSKGPGRLALEEHGHCEVPAGCGGVVLRWINPQKGVPILLHIYAKAKVEVFIDGIPPASTRPLVPPGLRVLAIHLSKIPAAKMWWTLRRKPSAIGMLLFGAFRDLKSHADSRVPEFLSAIDGTWHYTTDPPPNDSWLHGGFDAGKWQQMIEVMMPKPDESEPGLYFYEKLVNEGARPLGVSEPSRDVWIRREFKVESP